MSWFLKGLISIDVECKTDYSSYFYYLAYCLNFQRINHFPLQISLSAKVFLRIEVGIPERGGKKSIYHFVQILVIQLLTNTVNEVVCVMFIMYA